MDQFIKNVTGLANIRSWDQLVEWFTALSLGWQITVGLGAFGILIVVYIFIVAVFTDKEL